MHDALGDRMKERYENRTRVLLPRRTYTIVRVDGKAFHTWTRGCESPFDAMLARCIDEVAVALCEQAQGAVFAFAQSDEVSVLLTDFAKPTTDAWFDGNVQKIASVSASIATAAFNRAAAPYFHKPPALFDARVFVIPDPVETENYFIWRQNDAERNSLQSLCRAHASHREMNGKGRKEQHDLLHAKGVNWNDLDAYWRHGRCVVRTDDGWTVDRLAPVFTRQRDYLTSRVPRQWAEPSTREVSE